MSGNREEPVRVGTGNIQFVACFSRRIQCCSTLEFSGKQEGDTIAVVGPLGNGFTPRSGKSILIGGGIGIPPMLALAKSLSGEVQVVLGYRDAVQFLKEDFTPYASVYVSTEDGSVGTKGNVIDAIRAEGITADVIYACGPMPMLRGVKAFAAEQGIEAQISLEEHMACGIGACLGCVCTKKKMHTVTSIIQEFARTVRYLMRRP